MLIAFTPSSGFDECADTPSAVMSRSLALQLEL
jgi:hypothetical protein